MAESEEELKSLLMEVEEETERVGLKLNIQKTRIMASGPITSQQIDGETLRDFIFGDSGGEVVLNFHPRSKHLLISWLQSPYAVILEPPKIKSATVSTVSPSICHEVMGPDAIFLVF